MSEIHVVCCWPGTSPFANSPFTHLLNPLSFSLCSLFWAFQIFSKFANANQVLPRLVLRVPEDISQNSCLLTFLEILLITNNSPVVQTHSEFALRWILFSLFCQIVFYSQFSLGPRTTTFYDFFFKKKDYLHRTCTEAWLFSLSKTQGGTNIFIY